MAEAYWRVIDQRASGAWDFSETETAVLSARVAEIESALDQLTAQVKGLQELLEAPSDSKKGGK